MTFWYLFLGRYAVLPTTWNKHSLGNSSQSPSEGKFQEGGNVSAAATGTIPVSEQVFTKDLEANRPDACRACIPRYGRGHWRWEGVEKGIQFPPLGKTAS